MNKNKKNLTISIEIANTQNEEEQQLNQLKLIFISLKKDLNHYYNTFNQVNYQGEKQKLSSINNLLINQLVSYFEDPNSINDLSYSWIKNNQEISNLSKCIFINQKIAYSLSIKDYSDEFRILKIITEDTIHKNKLVQLAKQLKLNNRYADLLPCK